MTGKLDVRHLAPSPDSLDADELATLDADEAFDADLPEDDAEMLEEAVDAE